MKQYDPNEAEDRARLMLAIVVSLTILLGFYFLVERPQNEERRARAAVEAEAKQKADIEAGVSKATDDNATLKTRDEKIADSGRRVTIAGDKVKGSIALKGARLDDLELLGRYKTVERKEEVELLNPTGAPRAYYVDNGWIANKSGVKLPTADTVWSCSAVPSTSS